MPARSLAETLNGGFNGLFGEVVTCDTYHLRQIPFRPDVVFDIGANIGIFSRFARQLWPKAYIVAVEPHPDNIENFKRFTHLSNLVLIEKALGGQGPLFHGRGAPNGAHECYHTAGLGFPLEKMREARDRVEMVIIRTVTIAELVDAYWHPGLRSVMKIDCEGAENSIWGDWLSMKALAQMDYLALELHDYAFTAEEKERVTKDTSEALETLGRTHHCERSGVYFWATRKT